MSIHETLRGIKRGQTIDVETANGQTYTMHVLGTDYEAPDDYGAGYISADIELASESVTDEIPSESGTLSASSPYYSREFDTPTLGVDDPIYDEYEYKGSTRKEMVDVDWYTLGDVVGIRVLEDAR